MRLLILLLLSLCYLPLSFAAPPAADPATVQQLREDVIRQQERLDATRRDLDRQRQDQVEMEARVRALLADKEKSQEEAQKRQDDRISDIGQGVDRLGIIIAVAGVALGLVGWAKINAAVREVDREAQDSLKEIKAYGAHVETLLNQAKTGSAEIQRILGEVNGIAGDKSVPILSVKDQEKLVEAADMVKAKPELDRSASDWLVLGGNALSEEQFQAAIDHFTKVFTHPNASNLERARALNGRGVALGRQEFLADAAAAFDLAFQLASVEASPESRSLAAKALFNKGVIVGKADSAAAMEVYDEVVRRYGDDSQLGLREQVAKALHNKGVEVGKTDSAAAIAIYDDVVRRCGDDNQPAMREKVAMALCNKGVVVGNTDSAAAMEVYDQVVRRYRDDSQPTIREQVAKALVNKGVEVGKTDSAAAIAVYDEVVRRYRDDSQPAIRELVAKALVNKGFEVGMTDSAAAIAVYDEVVRRYGDDSQPGLREQVAMALVNKCVEVGKTDITAAITQLEDIQAKYGDDPELTSLTDDIKAQIAEFRNELN